MNKNNEDCESRIILLPYYFYENLILIVFYDIIIIVVLVFSCESLTSECGVSFVLRSNSIKTATTRGIFNINTNIFFLI